MSSEGKALLDFIRTLKRKVEKVSENPEQAINETVMVNTQLIQTQLYGTPELAKNATIEQQIFNKRVEEYLKP